MENSVDGNLRSTDTVESIIMLSTARESRMIDPKVSRIWTTVLKEVQAHKFHRRECPEGDEINLITCVDVILHNLGER